MSHLSLVERLERLPPGAWTWTLSNDERRLALQMEQKGLVEIEFQHHFCVRGRLHDVVDLLPAERPRKKKRTKRKRRRRR
jgi:hypothetical protein